LVAGLGISGCSNPREDVRVTLCKDMVQTQSAGAQPINWTAVSAEARGYEHAEVRLRFTAGGKDGEAACYYDYDAVDQTAITMSDPLAAYATSPSKMVLNGQALSRSALAQAVKAAMLKQGRELVDQVKKSFE
jgi:hypothetical protein